MGKSKANQRGQIKAKHRGSSGPAVPDEHHIRFLGEQLDQILQVWLSMFPEMSRPHQEIDDEVLASVVRERLACCRKKKAAAGLIVKAPPMHGKLADWEVREAVIDWFSLDFTPWAKEVVDAFGIEQFPTYCEKPPLPTNAKQSGGACDIHEESSHTESQQDLAQLLTGTDDVVQAGLRIVMWAAMCATPKLSEKTEVWRLRVQHSALILHWTDSLVFGTGGSWRSQQEILEWVKMVLPHLSQCPPIGRRSRKHVHLDNLPATLLAPQIQSDIPRDQERRKKQDEPKKKQDEPKKRSWTQGDLDSAIHEYKAQRASRYDELVQRVKSGHPGAKKAAQEMFGRNAIVKALGVRSPAMVTKSKAWHGIAADLGLQCKANEGHRAPRPKKIGLDMALQKQADTQADIVVDKASRNETIRLISKNLKGKEAEDTLASLDRGDMTDEQAHDIVRVLTSDEQ